MVRFQSFDCVWSVCIGRKFPGKGKIICRISCEEEQKAEDKQLSLQKGLLNKKTVKLLLHVKVGVGGSWWVSSSEPWVAPKRVHGSHWLIKGSGPCSLLPRQLHLSRYKNSASPCYAADLWTTQGLGAPTPMQSVYNLASQRLTC